MRKNLPPHHYAYIGRGVGVVRIMVNLKCGERYEKKNKGLSSLEKDLFIWRESEAEKLNIPPNYIFKDKYFRKLKKIILENSYRDCDWIFKEEAYKQSFFDRFR